MTRIDKILLIFVVALLCASSGMQVLAAYAGDKDWLLLASRVWLGGGRLYVDIVEVNPPLILWLYAIPVWVSTHILSFKDYQVLGLIGLGFVALSLWLSVLLIRLHPQFTGDKRRQICFALLLACVFVLFTRPAYFFDRDHIFFVLTFPYLLRFMPSLTARQIDWRMHLVIGVLAALGFCIKPYTLIFFTVLQLLVICRQRSFAILWSLENAIIYVISLIYLFCVWHFTPDYIRTVLPMALVTYSAFHRRSIGIFYCILAFITAGMTFADFRPRFVTPYRRDIYYFLGVAGGFLLYALAGNGWGYTYHPLLSHLLFLSGWALWEYSWLRHEHDVQSADVRQFVFGQRACAILLLSNALFFFYCIVAFCITPMCEWSHECKKAQPFIQYLKGHNAQSFGILGEDVHQPAAIARLSGARFSVRYNHLWMVPKLVSEGQEFTKHNQWIIEDVGRALADDLAYKKPEVMFVDNSQSFFGYSVHVDLIAFFSDIPEFREAWSHYHYASAIDRCKIMESGGNETAAGCKYDVYDRAP